MPPEGALPAWARLPPAPVAWSALPPPLAPLELLLEESPLHEAAHRNETQLNAPITKGCINGARIRSR
jgi:hypothetical protein